MISAQGLAGLIAAPKAPTNAANGGLAGDKAEFVSSIAEMLGIAPDSEQMQQLLAGDGNLLPLLQQLAPDAAQALQEATPEFEVSDLQALLEGAEAKTDADELASVMALLGMAVAQPGGGQSGYGGYQAVAGNLQVAAQSESSGSLNTFLMALKQGQARAPLPIQQDSAEQGGFQLLSGQLTETPDQTAAKGLPELPVNVPMKHAQWGQAVGERLVWMVRNQVHEARLKIDPPELGPLEVSISMKEDGRTQVHFQAFHPQTRELLEAEGNRLRQMMNNEGLVSVDVDVSQGYQSDAEMAGHEGSGDGGNQAEGEQGEGEVAASVAATVISRHDGLVDDYI